MIPTTRSQSLLNAELAHELSNLTKANIEDFFKDSMRFQLIENFRRSESFEEIESRSVDESED